MVEALAKEDFPNVDDLYALKFIRKAMDLIRLCCTSDIDVLDPDPGDPCCASV
jgi:hypothetical protein